MTERRHHTAVFTVAVGATTLLAACLHGSYSLSAMTNYGHANLILEDRWQLMGVIEAVNGCLLFGMTTAFLFGIIQKVSSKGLKGR